MGQFDQINFSGKDAVVRMCEDVLIVASPRHAEAIDWTSDPSAFPGLTVLACSEVEPIPLDTIRNCSLMVLEIDPSSRGSMERLAAVKHARPDLAIIAAIPNASVALVRTLVREGVVDVVSLPFSFDEVLECAVTVLSQNREQTSAKTDLAPMFAVAQSVGGCGATTVATHLAAELARKGKAGRGVAIVDLDLQFGSIADFLSANGKGSVVDLLEAQSRLDEELLRSVSRPSHDGLAVFAAPETIPPLESVDTDQLLSLLQMIRRHYDYVVLDLPSNWTNWTLSALSAADAVIMVAELSLPSLRQAKRRLELFDTVGIEREKTLVVVNRVQRRLFKTIDVNDVHETLHREVLGNLSLEEPGLESAQQQGLLIDQLHRKSRFLTDIRAVADTLSLRWPEGSGQ